MSRGRPRDKHKGSDLDTNQKLLTENDRRLYYTPASSGVVLSLHLIQQNVTIINDYAMTVVLPSVAEAKELSYTITVSKTGEAVTLTDYPNTDYNDSKDWGGDYTLDTAGDNITLKSTGKAWTVVSNNIV